MPKFANLRLASLAALAVLGVAVSVLAQQSTPPTSNGRKVVTRVAPDYPPLARRIHLEGVVRVEAVVRPNGSVRSTRILGGNPVLVDAAQIAFGKWKFEPSQNETVEIVQLIFSSR